MSAASATFSTERPRSAAVAPFSTERPRSAAVAPPKPKPPKGSDLLPGTGILRYGSQYAQSSGYERYAYVLVSRFDARRAARLPGTSIVYMSGTTVQEEWSHGVTYTEALQNDWLLKDPSGAYMKNIRYDGLIGDIGNPAYQRRFVENTLAFLKRTKVDGVFIDDVTADPKVMSRVYPAKYPDGAAWESAMVSFVLTVGRELKSRGYYVVANAAKFVHGDSRSDTGEHVAEFWRRIAPGVSGLMSENWLQNPNDNGQLRVLGSSWYENWNGWQNLVSVAQSRGVDFFGLAYGSAADARAMRYVRANFLLDWDGRGGALFFAKTDHPDPYHPAWVRQLGLPLRPKLERSPGIWQRRYERGMAVVNVTNAPREVLVFGKTYTIAGPDALFVRAPRS